MSNVNIEEVITYFKDNRPAIEGRAFSKYSRLSTDEKEALQKALDVELEALQKRSENLPHSSIIDIDGEDVLICFPMKLGMIPVFLEQQRQAKEVDKIKKSIRERLKQMTEAM